MVSRTRQVVLYSSALLIILSAISTRLIIMQANPEHIDKEELAAISAQLQAVSTTLKTGEVAKAPAAALTTMTWWYPGEPACQAVTEAAAFQPDVVKPEYFIVREGGWLELMTEEVYGCNGYSTAGIEQVKAIAPIRFVMVSSASASDMAAFIQHNEQSQADVAKLVAFVVANDFTGVELDFEDYGNWTPAIYAQYQSFLTDLGKALRAQGKQLMITLPPIQNASEANWYKFRLADFNQLPVDYLVVMAYDYQYDHGSEQPVAPLDWLANVIKYTKSQVVDDSKIVIGIPSYGYVADRAAGTIKIVTNEQAKQYAIYDKAERDQASLELIAKGGKYTLVYQDAVSLQAKINVVTENGVNQISIWHAGGNVWPHK